MPARYQLRREQRAAGGAEALNARVALWLVAAALLGLLAAGAGGVPLLDPDESRFARTSVEMLRSGDLVLPRFGGEPRLVKPPLLHWVQVFVFGTVGIAEWSARLHAALATLGSLLIVGWIGRRRFGDEGGAWAAVVFGTMPLVLVAGRVGTIDALLAVHVLAVIALDLAAPEGGYRASAAGALLGLAFLAKGPVGIVLPLVVVLAGRSATGAEVMPSLRTVVHAVTAWCVVVLPWGVVFLRRVGPGTVLELLRGEALDRYFVGTTHVEPPWFYLKVAVAGFLPWLSPLLLGSVRAWRRRAEPAARTALYAACGLIAGTIFLSIGRGKEASYLLPLAPLAALVAGWEIAREQRSPAGRSRGTEWMAASAVAIAAGLAIAAANLDAGEPRTVAMWGALAFVTAAFVAATARRRPPRAYAAAAAAAAITFAVAVALLLPAIGERKSAAGLIREVPALGTGRPLVTVEINVPSLSFYLDRRVEVIELDALDARLEQGDDPLFVLADVDLAAAAHDRGARLRELGRHGKLVVLEKRAATPGGESAVAPPA